MSVLQSTAPHDLPGAFLTLASGGNKIQSPEMVD
jgi:hypothetical protein